MQAFRLFLYIKRRKYAYRLIWYELCDVLVQSTKRYADEVVADVTPYISSEPENGEFQSGLRMGASVKPHWVNPFVNGADIVAKFIF